MNDVFALVDCNNFYASCERVFNPHLKNKPVCILSNNDGCVISRSNEAKAIGLEMGVPIFKVPPSFLKKYDVQVLSSNYTLYGDMSQRVVDTLKQFTNQIEVYSIDESFLIISNYTNDFNEYGKLIQQTVQKWTGIPVSVGIATSKTLAKAGNHIAKKTPEFNGVANLVENPETDELLSRMNVNKVWGVGSQYTKFLNSINITNAKQLKYSDTKFIQKNMTKLGSQTVLELRGIACKDLEEEIQDKKGICCAKSFGKKLEEIHLIKEALANYVSRAAEKLRKQFLVAKEVVVFLETNPFADDKQYFNSTSITLDMPTSNTPRLIETAFILLDKIFLSGFKYKKVGVLLNKFSKTDKIQYDLFKEQETIQQIWAMKTMDQINSVWGRNTLKAAACGTDTKSWWMNQTKLSKCYTTSWNELLEVN
jgi:DNA polymerase V